MAEPEIDYSRDEIPNGNSQLEKMFIPLKRDADESFEKPYSTGDFKTLYERCRKIQEQLKEQSKKVESIAEAYLIKYTKKNYSKIIDELGEKGLVAVLTQTPLEKTGQEKYDRVIESFEKQKEIAENSQDIDPARKYLEKTTRNNPEGDRMLIDYFLSDERFVISMLRARLKKEGDFIKKLYLGLDKKMDKEEFRNFLYRTAEKKKDDPEFLKNISEILYIKLIKDGINWNEKETQEELQRRKLLAMGIDTEEDF